jgi:transmembrane sensor
LASQGPAESVDDQAARWAVKVVYGDITPEGDPELRAWLASDRRHQGAYIRARAGLYAMEDRAGLRRQQSSAETMQPPIALHRPAPAPTRRFAVGGIAAGIAAVFLAAWLAFPGHQTGEPRILNLQDGSVVTLGQGGQIAFSIADGVRKVTLINGQASFKVAHDKAHPFVVRSGEVYAQATGTVYSVARVGLSGGTVSVSEGSVLVWPGDERDQAVLLHAGGKMTLDPGQLRPDAKAIAPALPAPDLAEISVDGDTIKTAAARFNRLNTGKIIVDGAAIADTKIVGLFRANDPEQFAQAAAAISGGRVEHRSGAIVIKAK